MPHYKLKRRGARPRKCLRVKKTSFEPESNQRPKDCQLATYSPPLYQLSYRRHTGRGQNLKPPEHGNDPKGLFTELNFIRLTGGSSPLPRPGGSVSSHSCDGTTDTINWS
ncbi:unnamed protein product [Leuciscus chuanchicus]